MDEGKLLTPVQVAERLQMEPETVQGWLRTGRLRGIKIGRYWRVSSEALREFIEARQTGLDPNGRNGDDEEELSPEDWAAVRRSLADVKAGRYVTLEEYEAGKRP